MAAGGSWTTENKVRPGVYIRFQSKNLTGMTVGERGTVALCVPLPWGPVGQVQTVEAGADLMPYTGFSLSAPENRLFLQLFQGSNRTPGPNQMLLYRPAGTGGKQAATPEESPIAATAKYPGTRGNDLSVVVTEVEGKADSFTVSTVLDGDIVDSQTVKTAEKLVDNDWVVFSDSSALTATTGVHLEGGVDPTVDGGDYDAFLSALAPYPFDVLLYDGDDAVIQQVMVQFIKGLAQDEGRHAQLVLANAQNPDSRFVINVCSAVTLATGETLTPGQTAWWAAGALAGAPYNQSLTAATYPGAVSVIPMGTSSQIAQWLTEGKFVLTADNGVVRVEQDINSLVSFTQEISNLYRKNRVMRLCSTLANDIYRQFVQNFLGVVNNNDQGRAQLRAVLLGYLLEIQSANGIQNLEPEDVSVQQGNEIDAVRVNLSIQPVDSMEKIYVTLELA